MYPTNEIPKVQEVKEPYSVTRENNNKKAIFGFCRSTGIVRYDYEDNSAIIFNILDGNMYITNCDNDIVFTGKPVQKYDLDLFQDATDRFLGFFSRQ